MRFSLDQLLAFTHSAETGSFSGAARQLGKAQSAVSTAVANLELDLGVSLFDRSRREPTLTDEGRALLPQAQALLTQARLFEGHADSMAVGEEGKLTLAAEESLLGAELEDLLVKMEGQFPQLELELLNQARADILTLVAEGRADIGLLITNFTLPTGTLTRPLGEMTIIAATSPDHPLAIEHSENEIVSFEKLMQHRQLVLTSREGGLDTSTQISQKVWRIESQYALIELLQRNIGWGWVPKHMAKPWLNDGSLRILATGGSGSLRIPVEMVLSASYREGTAGQWLFKHLPQLSFLSGTST